MIVLPPAENNSLDHNGHIYTVHSALTSLDQASSQNKKNAVLHSQNYFQHTTNANLFIINGNSLKHMLRVDQLKLDVFAQLNIQYSPVAWL